MNTDVRQSAHFARFMQNIGWKVDKIQNTYVYLKKFPFVGYFAKIPRPDPDFSLQALKNWGKKHRIFALRIAPFTVSDSPKALFLKKKLLKQKFNIEPFPFNPTTTITIDLTCSQEKVFSRFSQAKRRAVRKALKNGIVVKESKDIQSFIDIRKNQYRPLGFLVSRETKAVFESFSPDHASLLLAYQSSPVSNHTYSSAKAYKYVHDPIAGILLLMYKKTAYYWFASSLGIGKKLFAPTLLVWEALRLAQKKGCTHFDFEGIYDERFPKAAESWRGFTKFKEGFGGEKVIYLENFKQ